jgi:hypothetical protein
MSPKEKAKELYDLYRPKFFGNTAYKSLSKQCALIAQQNLLQKLKELNIKDSFEEQVKEEIEKL